MNQRAAAAILLDAGARRSRPSSGLHLHRYAFAGFQKSECVPAMSSIDGAASARQLDRRAQSALETVRDPMVVGPVARTLRSKSRYPAYTVNSAAERCPENGGERNHRQHRAEPAEREGGSAPGNAGAARKKGAGIDDA